MYYYLHDDPRLPSAWAPWFSHEYITYLSVQAIDTLMALPQVAVKSNPNISSECWPIGHKHIDLYKENYSEVRKLDPLWSFSYSQRNGEFGVEPPLDKTIEPWKVLVIYSTEPDLNPDCDLDLHKNQKMTGGSHGWRHMQFRLLGKTFGIAPESFRINMNFAKMSFENGNDYWGWRYLSRSAHYLADLGNPFHVKALPNRFLINNLFSLKKLFTIVSSVHQSYEVYVQGRFREGFPSFQEALLRGSREGQAAKSPVNELLGSYMHLAKERHNEIFFFFLDQFGRELINVFEKMNPDSHLDAATQTNMCAADAAKVIFRNHNLPALNFLDKITEEILFNVGKMLGILFSRFSA
ncbi:MAG: hypothetical protein ABSC11_04880 [Smithella sp.]